MAEQPTQQAKKQSRLNRAARKLPVVGQYQDDKSHRVAQNSWFTEKHPDGLLDEEPTVVGYLRSIIPTKNDVITYIADTFPFVRWILNYNLQWFIGDLIAGLTVGMVVIPQGMAYSKLADLPVQSGLYTSFVGAIVYWIFGSSKDITIGPVAVASIITGAILSDVANEHPVETREALAGTIAMLAGGVITALGLLRLGWLVDLISLSAVAAFITGSAVTICFGQLPVLLGIRHISGRDPAFRIGLNILKNLYRTRIDAALGLTALLLLYVMKFSCTWIAKRKPNLAKAMFFVSTLRTVLVMVFYTLISYIINRNRREDPLVRVLGFVPRGLHTAAPPLSLESNVLSTLLSQTPATVIALVIEHVSIAKSFGRINNYPINPNSELLAIGVTNLVGPLAGAYAATGSFSRTAINSKAGCRTPLAGAFTACLVLLAMYTLTGVFFFVPRCVLAAVIIHAIGDLITTPAQLYEFWKVSPLDVLIFITGVSITVFDNIEDGIYATIGLSLAVLVFRVFHAHGGFLGEVKVRTVKHEHGKWKPASTSDSGSSDLSRNIFLPLDRKDGSKVKIERPEPGVFIYRFSEGFNFPNANSQLDYMAATITAETRPTLEHKFDRPGDRPWNDYAPRRAKGPAIVDDRPILKVVILDFSAVNNVDLTSVQILVDIKKALDKHAAPNPVQWHFACIHSQWTKRALSAAGFGFPSFESENGEPEHFKSIYSLAEMQGVAEPGVGTKSPRASQMNPEDVELGDMASSGEKMAASRTEDQARGSSKPAEAPPTRMTAVHGINRPFFHPDVQSALVSAMATEELRLAILEDAEEDARAHAQIFNTEKSAQIERKERID